MNLYESINKMAEFSDLPDEIIEYIISLLDIKEIIFDVPLTSKRLYNISNRPYLWYCIHQQIISTDQFLKIFQTQRSRDYYEVTTNPFDKKSVLSYLQCDYCHKYYTKYESINRCSREHKTCLKCQLSIQSYGEKCIICTNPPTCNYCHEIIAKNITCKNTVCCKKLICLKCTKNKSNFHMEIQLTKRKRRKILMCRDHYFICELCGHWSRDKYVATCCNRIVCQMCQTFCHGCGHSHCAEHCTDNKCHLTNCCFGPKTSQLYCTYNGHICTDCKCELTHDQMICHPNTQSHCKYCVSCFNNKTWICSYCDQIVPLQKIKTCDCCHKLNCADHMYFIQKGRKYICPDCYHETTETCDICQKIFNSVRINHSIGLKYCDECEKKFDISTKV